MKQRMLLYSSEFLQKQKSLSIKTDDFLRSKLSLDTLADETRSTSSDSVSSKFAMNDPLRRKRLNYKLVY